jgi:sulfite exporter TauE/SafE
MFELWDVLSAVCGSIAPTGGVLAGLFLAGAAGSALHCGPMCGGFVLAQVANRLSDIHSGRLSEWSRVEAAMLLPYHAGRITTYALLGAVSGLGGALLAGVPYLAALLLALAAAGFLSMALRSRTVSRPLGATPCRTRCGLGNTPAAHQPGRRSPLSFLDGFAPRITGRSGPGSLGLGLLLGLLPCGFLYTALAVAAAGQSPLLGALGMALFGLGTVPVLVAVGIAGHAAGRRWSRAAARITPVAMVVNAAVLLVLAARMLVV